MKVTDPLGLGRQMRQPLPGGLQRSAEIGGPPRQPQQLRDLRNFQRYSFDRKFGQHRAGVNEFGEMHRQRGLARTPAGPAAGSQVFSRFGGQFQPAGNRRFVLERRDRQQFRPAQWAGHVLAHQFEDFRELQPF